MAKGTTFDTDLLKLIFNATPIANIADNAVGSPLSNLWVSLHTADPGAGGAPTTSEVAYSSYARAVVVRSTAGWSVTGTSASPVAAVTFPLGTGGSGTVTNFSIVTTSIGAGKILYTGSVSPSITTGNGITPILTTASTITES